MGTGARRRPTWAWRFLVGLVAGTLRRLRGWRIHAHRPARVPPPDRPLVAVFNHTSMVDGFLVADVVWRGLRHWVRPLVKAELFDVPVLGTLACAAGAIPVLRADDQGREAAYDRAVEELRDGATILFAPEGTVTHDGSLLPLRHGAARLAIEAGAEVLVVTHFGAQRGFSPVVRFPERGAVVTLSLDLLQPREDEDAAALTGRIAAVLLDRSEELRDTYPQADPAARWWPPYAAPAAPTATARQNLERYQESMAASVAAARERMARYAEEHELEERLAQARTRAQAAGAELADRSKELAEEARHRAELATEQARNAVEERTEQLRELGEQTRERVEELGEQVRERAQELGEQARDRADDAGLARRSGDPDPGPSQRPEPGRPDDPTDEGRPSEEPPAGPLSA